MIVLTANESVVLQVPVSEKSLNAATFCMDDSSQTPFAGDYVPLLAYKACFSLARPTHTPLEPAFVFQQSCRLLTS